MTILISAAIITAITAKMARVALLPARRVQGSDHRLPLKGGEQWKNFRRRAGRASFE